MSWARLRQYTFRRYSNTDSSTHTTAVMAASNQSWPMMSSGPNRAMKLFSRSTTTSTLSPMSSGGRMSKTLFRIEKAVAAKIRLRKPDA